MMNVLDLVAKRNSKNDQIILQKFIPLLPTQTHVEKEIPAMKEAYAVWHENFTAALTN